MYTEFTKKKVFELPTLAAAAPARCRHGRQKVLIPECNLTGTETMVNLKRASFIVIMLSHEGLTHIQSQIKHQLLFGESFALSSPSMIRVKNLGKYLHGTSSSFWALMALSAIDFVHWRLCKSYFAFGAH